MVFTENGLEINGDPKHAAILLKETGMDMCSGNVQCCELTSYADTKLLDTLADDTRSYMPPIDARRHRSAVARVVHMATDRPDLDVAACTLAKTMTHPTSGDEWLVKRVCRYIKGRPRHAQTYEHQGEARELVVQTDSNWASCTSTRQSNSEGWVFRRRHLLHHWCRVQARVALSTGEAELYAQIHGLQGLLSLKYLMEELRAAECRSLECVAEVDSTACKGIMLRHGVGQLKHLATRTMWAQQIPQQEGIEVRRISCVVNSTDCRASHEDPYRAVVQMGGVWLGAQLDDKAGFFLQFRCTQRDEFEVPVHLQVHIPVSLHGTEVSTQWWLDI